MFPPRPTTFLLVVAGLLLATNFLWLFPHEGETRYTYERSAVGVENGTLTYDHRNALGFDEENNLDAVGCEPDDGEGERACSFDHYLVDEGPVTIPAGQRLGHVRPEFVQLDGEYYRRIHRANESSDPPTVAHDVERVTPWTVLAESAVNVSNDSRPAPEYTSIQTRVAVTGDTVTSYERLDEDELGTIYRQDGSYYTVVVADETPVSRGLDPLRYEMPRALLAIIGGLVVVGALGTEFQRP